MRDPFRPNSNSQLIREAQLGLSLVAVLLFVFVYVAYYRITGYGRSIPDHVRRAPVAESVWPNSLAGTQKHLTQSPPQRQSIIAQLFPNATQAKDRNPVVNSGISDSIKTKLLAQSNAQSNAESNPVRQSNYVAPIEPQFDLTPKQSSPLQRPTEVPHRNSSVINTVIPPAVETHSENVQQTIAIDPVDPFLMPEKIGKFETDHGQSQSKPISIQPPVRPSASNSNFAKPAPTNPATAKTEVVENSKPSTISPSFSSNQFEPRLHSPRPIEGNDLRAAKSEIMTTEIMTTSFVGDVESTEPQSSALVSTIPSENSEPNENSDSMVASIEATSARPRLPATQPSLVSPSNQVETENADSPPAPTSTQNPEFENFHIVTAGDSLWTIAQIHYNDGRYFRALYQHNQFQVDDVDNLVGGTRLETPPLQQLTAQWPEYCPGTNSTATRSPENVGNRSADLPQYETEPGDTLFEIARQRLGQASRYLEIMELNAERLPLNVNHLSPLPGQIRLQLPQ